MIAVSQIAPKEYHVDYPMDKCMEAAIKLQELDKHKLISSDNILKQVRIYAPAVSLSFGYMIDFAFSKEEENKTKVLISVSKSAGGMTAGDVGLANQRLANCATIFSQLLQGRVIVKKKKKSLGGKLLKAFFIIGGLIVGALLILAIIGLIARM